MPVQRGGTASKARRPRGRRHDESGGGARRHARPVEEQARAVSWICRDRSSRMCRASPERAVHPHAEVKNRNKALAADAFCDALVHIVSGSPREKALRIIVVVRRNRGHAHTPTRPHAPTPTRPHAHDARSGVILRARGPHRNASGSVPYRASPNPGPRVSPIAGAGTFAIGRVAVDDAGTRGGPSSVCDTAAGISGPRIYG